MTTNCSTAYGQITRGPTKQRETQVCRMDRHYLGCSRSYVWAADRVAPRPAAPACSRWLVVLRDRSRSPGG